MNTEGWFPLGLTCLISLLSKRLWRILQHHNLASLILQHSAFFMVQLLHLYMTTGKTLALTIWDFASKVMSLFFNTVSRFVIAFLPRNKCPFNFIDAVTVHNDFGAKENKICHCVHIFQFYLLRSDGTRLHDLSFLNVEFQTRIFTLLFDPHQETL